MDNSTYTNFSPLRHFIQIENKPSRIRAWTQRYIYVDAFSFKHKVLYFLVFLSVILVVDIATKYWAEQTLVRPVYEANLYEGLAPGEILTKFHPSEGWYAIKEVSVIEHFWSFFYVRNYNVGFSMLSFLNKYFGEKMISRFVILVQVLALCGILSYFIITRMELWLPLVLIISGGFANVIDRGYRGYVVDFIKWYWEASPIAFLNPWPIFNLADVSITFGMFLFIWSIFIK